MNRGREMLHRFLADNFGATIRNVTIWILEDVSKGMEKGIREIRLVEGKNLRKLKSILRRAESGNKNNRRISQVQVERLNQRRPIKVWASSKSYFISQKSHTFIKIAEDYEKLKEKVDQEIKLLEDNSEEEGTRMDSGIEVREQDEQNDEV